MAGGVTSVIREEAIDWPTFGLEASFGREIGQHWARVVDWGNLVRQAVGSPSLGLACQIRHKGYGPKQVALLLFLSSSPNSFCPRPATHLRVLGQLTTICSFATQHDIHPRILFRSDSCSHTILSSLSGFLESHLINHFLNISASKLCPSSFFCCPFSQSIEALWRFFPHRVSR